MLPWRLICQGSGPSGRVSRSTVGSARSSKRTRERAMCTRALSGKHVGGAPLQPYEPHQA
jgi:hypothetical protein